MGRTSRSKELSRAAASRHRKSRRTGAYAWPMSVGAIVVVGIIAIAMGRGGSESAGSGKPTITDHWHASVAFDVCGKWRQSVPVFEAENGLHTHAADGVIHIHPRSASAAGNLATIGNFFGNTDPDVTGFAQSVKVTSTSLRLWQGPTYTNGDKCADMENKPGTLRWSVDGKEKTGDPSKYRPQDLEVIAIYFIPKGGSLPVVPTQFSAALQVLAGEQGAPTAIPPGAESAPGLEFPPSSMAVPMGDPTIATSPIEGASPTDGVTVVTSAAVPTDSPAPETDAGTSTP